MPISRMLGDPVTHALIALLGSGTIFLVGNDGAGRVQNRLPSAATQAAATHAAATHAAIGDLKRYAARDSAVDSERLVVQRQNGETQVDEFLSFRSGERVARLTLHAGALGANGGMNFNGHHGGTPGLVLPVGWQMRVRLVNDDNALPHSAMIVPVAPNIPMRGGAPAFAGATSVSQEEGLMVGDSTDFSFKTERAGEYWLFCGVPGHGKAGMYLRFTVSRTARAPRYS